MANEADRAQRAAILRFLSETSVLVGATLYGAGWVFFARFYTAFGVYPEEVGINFGFVVVRASLILLAVGAVIGLSAAVSGGTRRLLKLAASESLDVSSRIVATAIVLFDLLIVASAIVAYVVFPPWSRIGPLWFFALMPVAVIVVVGAVWVMTPKIVDAFGLRTGRSAVTLRMLNVALVVSVLFAAGYGALSFAGADHLASRVRDGQPITGIAFQVPLVQVHLVSPGQTPLGMPGPEECVSLLGQSEGEVVFVRSSQPGDPVVRVPMEAVVVVHGPCRVS